MSPEQLAGLQHPACTWHTLHILCVHLSSRSSWFYCCVLRKLRKDKTGTTMKRLDEGCRLKGTAKLQAEGPHLQKAEMHRAELCPGSPNTFPGPLQPHLHTAGHPSSTWNTWEGRCLSQPITHGLSTHSLTKLFSSGRCMCLIDLSSVQSCLWQLEFSS